jgi:hypothetical protein
LSTSQASAEDMAMLQALGAPEKGSLLLDAENDELRKPKQARLRGTVRMACVCSSSRIESVEFFFSLHASLT